jgi:hypothetical protein
MRMLLKANDRDGVFALFEHYYPTEYEALVADLASLQARGELNPQTLVKAMSPLLVKLRSHFADIANAPDAELLKVAKTKVALLKALQGVDVQACTEAAEHGAVSPERGAKLVEQVQGAARDQGLSQMHALAAAHAHPTQHAAVSRSDWNAIGARYVTLGGSPGWLKATMAGKSVAALPIEVRCASGIAFYAAGTTQSDDLTVRFVANAYRLLEPGSN